MSRKVYYEEGQTFMEAFRQMFRDPATEKNINITNKNYRKFLDKGEIDTISEDDIKLVLKKMDAKYMEEAQALVIALYYTGGRPNEVLRLRALHVKKEDSYICIQMPASKNGLPRPIYIRQSKALSRRFWAYVSKLQPERYLFYHYVGRYERKRMGKYGLKVRIEISDKLRHHVYKWFSVLPMGTIPTYYLRHNRFSKIAEKGGTPEDIRQMKGSKTTQSAMPYMHMSTYQAKKNAKMID